MLREHAAWEKYLYVHDTDVHSEDAVGYGNDNVVGSGRGVAGLTRTRIVE